MKQSTKKKAVGIVWLVITTLAVLSMVAWLFIPLLRY